MENSIHINQQAILEMQGRYRANLINSITGHKSANLIATRGVNGGENVAVFSSVTHLGSNPALIGFVMRPTTVPRHTYDNIKSLKYFTINHINESIIANAHQTAASYEKEISEFDQTALTSEYINESTVPFVKEASIKILCSYVNEYLIKENNTILIVGKMEDIYLPKNALSSDGWVNLETAKSVAINGLDGYSSVKLMERYSYAKPDKPLNSLKDKL